MGYKGKLFLFIEEVGIIPAYSRCYCYDVEGEYLWVMFDPDLLQFNQIKIHHSIIDKFAIKQ